MKTVFFFLFILLSLTCFAQVQWAPIGAKWYISKIEGTTPPNEGYILYEVSRDTLIQDKKVKVINRTYFYSDGKNISDLGNEYTYEEDSVVYYWRNGHFYILYDFRAQPGDKWTVYGSSRYADLCGYDSLGVVVVDSVATLTVNNQKLKAIYTSPDSNSDWRYEGVILERIGNITHLKPNSEGCLLDSPDDEGSLRCYEDSIIGIYKAGYCQLINCNCNELKNYTTVNNFKSSTIKIYPNPVVDYLNIFYENGYKINNLAQVEIYTIRGEKVGLFENVDKCFIGFLKQGCYILKLSFPDQIIHLKFIKK
jgi:hypothetical protein